MRIRWPQRGHARIEWTVPTYGCDDHTSSNAFAGSARPDLGMRDPAAFLQRAWSYPVHGRTGRRAVSPPGRLPPRIITGLPLSLALQLPGWDSGRAQVAHDGDSAPEPAVRRGIETGAEGASGGQCRRDPPEGRVPD